MRILKAFTGEENGRQKQIRHTFHRLSVHLFLGLMRLTRFDRFMEWQQGTTRKNQMRILVVMGGMMALMTVSVFLRKPASTDTFFSREREVMEAIQTGTGTGYTVSNRVLRVSRLLDSLGVDEKRMRTDSAYRRRTEDKLIKVMAAENLMEDRKDK